MGWALPGALGDGGYPFCIVDDEYSIGRFSKYTTLAVAAPETSRLRENGRISHRHGTPDEFARVGAFPHPGRACRRVCTHRDELCKVFRVPTPGWDVVKWAWNKWNTYSLAKELDIPIPRTWCPKSIEDIDKIDAEFRSASNRPSKKISFTRPKPRRGAPIVARN